MAQRTTNIVIICHIVLSTIIAILLHNFVDVNISYIYMIVSLCLSVLLVIYCCEKERDVKKQVDKKINEILRGKDKDEKK